ncbi:unnamed protein product [Vitrella brassicaformis CCMP3155]|uniref:Uncharacterized protein n=1 Tax=Vitrella brassicaformis (strain CCMP3155) TaxID=1169540 RepID=A0A0G4GNY2_VITBC|nr:unnamed protein product [Vitrella brassicaformis CCMP3155]|eukprot:CEM31879.1 unnamed protein product [Vitrella brassicaformis CCMP3155]
MSGLVEPSISVRFAGDGEADEPVVVKESVAHSFTYFLQVLDGGFQEGQQREVRIERISRAVGVVVLQHELDIIKSLTKDNLLDAMIALDYLQFDTDKVFTPGSSASLLWRIHRNVVVEGWLRDSQLATTLLDSFSHYAFIARFIHQHPDIRTALLPALCKKPDVISAQWRRCERGEDETNDSIEAAISLVDSLVDGLSHGRIDIGNQEVAQFITKATGSESLAAAYAAAFEADVFADRAVMTTQPFANNQQGSVTCLGFSVTVAGLPHPYTPPNSGPTSSSDPPPNAIRDGDAKVADIGGWRVVFERADDGTPVESPPTCFASDASLEIASGGDSDGTVRLHGDPEMIGRIHMGDDGPSVRRFALQILRGGIGTCLNRRNISAESLAQQGAGEARLKDVKMTMTVRHFPMRALALHYLRLCVKEGRWDDVKHMARSIRREVALYMLTCLAQVRHHRLRLMLCWAAAVGDLPEKHSERIVSKLTTDLIEENPADVAAVLPIIPGLPAPVQTAFEDALKGAVDAQDDECFHQLYDAFVEEAAERQRFEVEKEQLRQERDQEKAARQRLEAEVERLRQENDQLRRGTKRPREEMEGHHHQHQRQQQQQEGEADHEMKS